MKLKEAMRIKWLNPVLNHQVAQVSLSSWKSAFVGSEFYNNS